ncbi:MAG: helix-turn-helix domain-containing protein [Propionicimonas sp.]|nr:helix-turn-helix domain-containing protein [Propionicimonas sp.]
MRERHAPVRADRGGNPEDGAAVGRRRDPAATKRALLEAACRRFAHEGFASTTVRSIAGDVGVNVALINRYFDSKEGLFEACLRHTLNAVRAARTESGSADLDAVIEVIGEQVTASAWGDGSGDVLLLLLRSSGDERTERLRTTALLEMVDRIALLAPEVPGRSPEVVRLRAQLVLAAAVGAAMLRSARDFLPLAGADAQEIAAPLGDFVRALLSSRAD